MQIMQEIVKEVSTGKSTVGDREMVLVLLANGMWKIEARGKGQPIKLSDERFSSQREALKAVSRYEDENAKDLEKRDFMNRTTGRSKAPKE